MGQFANARVLDAYWMRCVWIAEDSDRLEAERWNRAVRVVANLLGVKPDALEMEWLHYASLNQCFDPRFNP